MGLFRSKKTPIFDMNKFNVCLKTAGIRTTAVINKKRSVNSQKRREIAILLDQEKFELARIQVEAVIRDDVYASAYEIIYNFLQLVTSRSHVVEREQFVPTNLLEALTTIVWSAPYSEIKELQDLRDQLGYKYGNEFIQDSLTNKLETVNPKVISKLSMTTPPMSVVQTYLESIAKQYNVVCPEPEPEISPLQPIAPASVAVNDYGLDDLAERFNKLNE